MLRCNIAGAATPLLCALAVLAASLIPHRSPACLLAGPQALPWVQEQRAGCSP